jgi:hypothetical protein
MAGKPRGIKPKSFDLETSRPQASPMTAASAAVTSPVKDVGDLLATGETLPPAEAAKTIGVPGDVIGGVASPTSAPGKPPDHADRVGTVASFPDARDSAASGLVTLDETAPFAPAAPAAKLASQLSPVASPGGSEAFSELDFDARDAADDGVETGIAAAAKAAVAAPPPLAPVDAADNGVGTGIAAAAKAVVAAPPPLAPGDRDGEELDGTEGESQEGAISPTPSTSKSIKFRIAGELVELPLPEGEHPLSSMTTGVEGDGGVSVKSGVDPCQTLESIVELKDQLANIRRELAEAEKDKTKDEDRIQALRGTLASYQSSLQSLTGQYLDAINTNREDIPATRIPGRNEVEYKEDGKVVVTQRRDPNTKEVWYDVAENEGPRTIRVPRIKDGKPTDICDILQYDAKGNLVDAIIAEEPEGSKSQINKEKLAAALRERDLERGQATELDASISVRGSQVEPTLAASAELDEDLEQLDEDELDEDELGESVDEAGDGEKSAIASTKALIDRGVALSSTMQATSVGAADVADAANFVAQQSSAQAARLKAAPRVGVDGHSQSHASPGETGSPTTKPAVVVHARPHSSPDHPAEPPRAAPAAVTGAATPKPAVVPVSPPPSLVVSVGTPAPAQVQLFDNAIAARAELESKERRENERSAKQGIASVRGVDVEVFGRTAPDRLDRLDSAKRMASSISVSTRPFSVESGKAPPSFTPSSGQAASTSRQTGIGNP